MKKLRIGYCYNLIDNFPFEVGQPEDINAEWTSAEDLETLRNGLCSAGFDVIDVGDPENLLIASIRGQIDIVFSIAEMTGFRYRESIAPVLCEIFKIPYALSTPDVLTIALDKHISNLLVKSINILTPEWRLIKTISDFDNFDFNKPAYILKPVAEGSSIGISKESIVHSKQEAFGRIEYLLNVYKQPVLLQEFLNITEVTIGVIEAENKIKALSPLVVSNKGIFDVQYKRKSAITDKCIFIENDGLVKKVQDIAVLIYAEFGCRDTARIDFKVDANENIYFIEINPLTDYTPRKDFCKSAFASGLGYEQLLQTIIFNAWKRSQK